MNAVIANKTKRRAIAAEQEAYLASVYTSLEDVKSGKIKKFKTAADLLKALETKLDHATLTARNLEKP